MTITGRTIQRSEGRRQSRIDDRGRGRQSRPQESEQDDKWSFCLTAGTLCQRIRRDDEQTTAPEPYTGLQGESGAGRIKGDRTLAQLAEHFDVHPNQITTWKAQLEGRASDIFGSGSPAPSTPAVDVKSLHAKIGELTLENDFLEGALSKAGLLSAKR